MSSFPAVILDHGSKPKPVASGIAGMAVTKDYVADLTTSLPLRKAFSSAPFWAWLKSSGLDETQWSSPEGAEQPIVPVGFCAALSGLF